MGDRDERRLDEAEAAIARVVFLLKPFVTLVSSEPVSFSNVRRLKCSGMPLFISGLSCIMIFECQFMSSKARGTNGIRKDQQ